MTQHIKTLEFRLYLNQEQENTLTSWLHKCAWIYNNALAMRKKRYDRHKKNTTYLMQQGWLTNLRSRIESVRFLPVKFARSALRRAELAYDGFFRRRKASQKTGYPRFKAARHYKSMDFMEIGNYICDGRIRIPKLGEVRARCRFDEAGEQIGLRIIRRATGWYAQVLVKQEVPAPLPSTGQDCGLDLGLESFATLDSGDKIENPRLYRNSHRELKCAQRRLSRCKKYSNRRTKARHRVALIHERIKRQRRGHAHRVSRDIVNRFDRIAIEKLNVKGMSRGMLSKSVNDAGWGQFIAILTVKAANAGRVVVAVNPSGTSQECPRCGAVAKKTLSERIHHCRSCGFRCDRDQAAAMVIRQRAFRPACAEGTTSTRTASPQEQADPLKREVRRSTRS